MIKKIQSPQLLNSLLKIVLAVVVLFTSSCVHKNIPAIEASSSNSPETRLGETDYYLRLPDSLHLTEARGKEGQLGFNIQPNDSSSTLHGFIEIIKGRPVGGRNTGSGAKVFATSYLAGSKVNWEIYQTETGYFIAFTNEAGDLNAEVSSKSRTEVDNLISVIATLRKK